MPLKPPNLHFPVRSGGSLTGIRTWRVGGGLRGISFLPPQGRARLRASALTAASERVSLSPLLTRSYLYCQRLEVYV